MRLTKDILTSVAKVKTMDLEVSEWGEGMIVTIKGWTISEADEIVRNIMDSAGSPKNFMQAVVAVSLIDHATGELMFADEEGFAELGNLAPNGMMKVHNAALRFNSLEVFCTDNITPVQTVTDEPDDEETKAKN